MWPVGVEPSVRLRGDIRPPEVAKLPWLVPSLIDGFYDYASLGLDDNDWSNDWLIDWLLMFDDDDDDAAAAADADDVDDSVGEVWWRMTMHVFKRPLL